MPAALAVDELRGDPDPRADLAHAPFQDIADVQPTAQLAHLDRPALVGEGRVAGEDEQPGDLREIGDQVLGDTVAEIFLLGIAAHVDERQHRDRRLVW
jgi:hypothetical protein